MSELVRPATLKKVAIIGYATTADEAPYKDDSWEIWGLNSLYKHIQGVPISRYSRWFEIHRKDYLLKTQPEHWEKLKEFSRVYMTEKHEDIPNSEPYPLDEIVNELKCVPYFTNSVSYMIALAIAERYDVIGVWGVDMAVGPEYSYQRPSCEYFLGIAQGLGIQIVLPDACDLLKTKYLYGFEDEKREKWDNKVDKTKNYCESKVQECMQQMQQVRDTLNQYKGAAQMLQDIKKVW